MYYKLDGIEQLLRYILFILTHQQSLVIVFIFFVHIISLSCYTRITNAIDNGFQYLGYAEEALIIIIYISPLHDNSFTIKIFKKIMQLPLKILVSQVSSLMNAHET